MHPILSRNLYFVREHVGLFKAANEYDILDPETKEEVLFCREPTLGRVTRMLRFTQAKRMTPFDIHITTPNGQPVIQVRRGVSLFLSKVDVFDDHERKLGGFKQNLFSIGGRFDILDPHGHPMCSLKGKWTGWEFRFAQGDRIFATVTKKWAGLGKELFTSADNYMLQISGSVAPDSGLRMLIMAAVLCIDLVLKK